MKLIEKDPKKRQTPQSNAIMAVVCAYVIYLGVNILRGYATGKGDGTPAWVQIVFGILFIAFGGFFLARYLIRFVKMREEEKFQGEDSETNHTEDSSLAEASDPEDAEAASDTEDDSAENSQGNTSDADENS